MCLSCISGNTSMAAMFRPRTMGYVPPISVAWYGTIWYNHLIGSWKSHWNPCKIPLKSLTAIFRGHAEKKSMEIHGDSWHANWQPTSASQIWEPPTMPEARRLAMIDTLLVARISRMYRNPLSWVYKSLLIFHELMTTPRTGYTNS